MPFSPPSTCEEYIRASLQLCEVASTVLSVQREKRAETLVCAPGDTTGEFWRQRQTQECDSAAHSLTHNLEVYPSLPEPFVRQDSEFPFLRSGQLLNVALETGVYYVGCKLCFVPRCLRYESRIDLSEVMVSG